MTSTPWTRLPAAVVLLALACGDSGNPGSDGSTGDPATSAGPTAPDDTTDGPPTSGPDDTSGGLDATTDAPTTAPPAQCDGPSDCPPSANLCETPACSDGLCGFAPAPQGTPQPDDPGNCMKSQCDGAGGVEQVADDADVANDLAEDCVSPACQDGQMTEVPADDPPPDTLGDCKRTTCEAGEVAFVADDDDLPDDTVECTLDTCDGGAPKFVPKPANTLCGPDGDMFCHDDATCALCKQVTDACEDDTNTEANETQATAHSLGAISDDDSTGSTLCPVLDGADDVDWFVYSADDKFPYVVDPDRLITTDMSARLCVYFECDSGTTTVTCAADEVDDVAPGGQSGCCSTGQVAPTLNCTGLDEASTVWIRVDNVDMLECVGYQLDYHF